MTAVRATKGVKRAAETLHFRGLENAKLRVKYKSPAGFQLTSKSRADKEENNEGQNAAFVIRAALFNR